MLGRFEVFVDSRLVPAEAWVQRRATDLVKLLALAPGHRMSRDEVLERYGRSSAPMLPLPTCTRPRATLAARSATGARSCFAAESSCSPRPPR